MEKVTKPIVLNETFSEKLATTNNFLSSIAKSCETISADVPKVTTGTSEDGSTTITVENKDGTITTKLVDGTARASVNTLSARMDTFTSLPEGSTSGNAELADIRVGANGTTYDTAGNAVRGQIGELKSDLDGLDERLTPIAGVTKKLNLEYIDGYYNDSGEIISVEWASRTERISLDGIDNIIFDGSYINFPAGFTNFYKNGENIYHISEGSLTTVELPFIVDCAEYDEVEFSFNKTGIDNIIIYSKIYNDYENTKGIVNKLVRDVEALNGVKFVNDFAPKLIPNFSFPIGENFDIYKENVVLADNEQGIVDYLANDMTEKKFVLTQESEINKEYTHFIYNKDMTSSISHDFYINFKQVNNSAKKVLLLGDSTIDTSPVTNIPPEAKALKDTYGDNLTLIGTRGTSPYLHCGIGGWSASDWWNQESDSSNVNPFYNPSLSHFDFGYGLTQNNLDIPDVVIIQLGINDVTAATNPTRTKVLTDTYIESMNNIISNIKDYNSAIKVYVNLIIPPSKDWNHYMAYAGSYLSPNIAKQHDIYASARALNELIGMDGFLPINCIIDRDNDLADRVHPNGTGYEKIGQFLSKCLSVI